MKYLLSFLLIALLSGCGYSARHTAKNIGNQIKKSCASLCLTTHTGNALNAATKEDAEPISVFTTSVLERTGNILTW